MRCFFNAGTPVGISAAACKQNPFIVEADVVHKGKVTLCKAFRQLSSVSSRSSAAPHNKNILSHIFLRNIFRPL